MTALIWFGIGFAIALLLRARVASRTERDSPARAPAPPRTTGTGRAILRTIRAVNDVRAASRGPGAYGKRLVRRSAFRAVRRW